MPVETFPSVAAGPGIARQVLADSAALMLVSFRFETGAVGARHSHPHVQSTHVESGRFRFCLGEDSFEVGPGDSFVIASHAEHGCECLEAGRLIDAFAPRRDDFL